MIIQVMVQALIATKIIGQILLIVKEELFPMEVQGLGQARQVEKTINLLLLIEIKTEVLVLDQVKTIQNHPMSVQGLIRVVIINQVQDLKVIEQEDVLVM
jgi:hypothetical protein